eukprot:UN02255
MYVKVKGVIQEQVDNVLKHPGAQIEVNIDKSGMNKLYLTFYFDDQNHLNSVRNQVTATEFELRLNEALSYLLAVKGSLNTTNQQEIITNHKVNTTYVKVVAISEPRNTPSDRVNKEVRDPTFITRTGTTCIYYT